MAEGEVLALEQLDEDLDVAGLELGAGDPAQFLVAWEGAPSGRGTRELRLEVVRLRGDDVTVAWSTGDLFPEGVMARDYRVRGTEVTIRYELHYPGWTPGCDGQTEQEDVYRFVPERGTLVRASRRQINEWHAGLHQYVGRILSALASGDRGALAQLVPDATLRSALPARLDRDPACDARLRGLKSEVVWKNELPAPAPQASPA